MRIKYPRTKHLVWSLGATTDDKILHDTSCFHGKNVVVTEKMDGENTTLYNDYYHARSLDGRDHPSRSWVKQLHANIKQDIPPNWRICGENLYAKHAIKYDNLTSYFKCFSIWDETNTCLSWKDTVEWCSMLGIEHVRVIFEFIWDDIGSPYFLKGLGFSDMSDNPLQMEGYVVRNADSFHYDDFGNNIAKYVRANHVQPNSKHWMHSEITKNDLIKTEIQ